MYRKILLMGFTFGILGLYDVKTEQGYILTLISGVLPSPARRAVDNPNSKIIGLPSTFLNELCPKFCVYQGRSYVGTQAHFCAA